MTFVEIGSNQNSTLNMLLWHEMFDGGYHFLAPHVHWNRQSLRRAPTQYYYSCTIGMDTMILNQRQMRKSKVTSRSGQLDCLFSLGVIVSLWSIWTSSTSSSRSTVSSPSRNMFLEKSSNYQDLVPVFLDKQNRPFYVQLGAHELSVQQPLGRRMPASPEKNETVSKIVERKSPRELTSPSHGSDMKHSNKANIASSNSATSLQALLSPRNLIQNDSKRIILQNTPFYFSVTASCAVILVAISARRMLHRIQRWEQQSQEDSLAYDMAYTDNYSEIGYGSFVSTSWSDDLDKFDV